MNNADASLNLAIWAPTLIGTVFAFCFGACAGSFLNVLVWRLPTGQSVVTPPSRCPICGHRLSWRENLPIIGWLILRGRCKACHAKISIQYPAIELVVALLFAATFLVFYGPLDRGLNGLFQDAASPWWHLQGFERSWPAFVVVVILISGLVAMTLVDAKTMLIPVEIPTVVTIVAFVGWTAQGFLPEARNLRDYLPIPAASWTTGFAAGGMLIGLGVSRWMISTGRLRQSFSDWYDHVKEGDDGSAYPHARREMMVEVAFLLPGLAGAGIACVVAAWIGYTSSEPVCQPMTLLGGSMLGWIVGGGLVWAIRIFGSLAFGREAMGLGDVHLQAAVGAALGWKVALLAFFVAVFIALLWALASVVFRRFSKFFRKEIPFGPHLAAAAILFVVARGPVVSAIDGFYGGVLGLLQHAPGVGQAIDEKPGRSLPAQLAQPRDQR
ncbi:MAG: prepilin peptidase [Planctomycetota bacterium]|nr:prepilin peptidase [Planctomycetota bacterium]